MADKRDKKSYSSKPTTQHGKNGSISLPTQQRAKKNSSSVSPTHLAKENSSSPPATEGHKKVGFRGRRNFHVTDSVLHTKQGYSSTSIIQHKKTGSISIPTQQRTKKNSSSVSPTHLAKENSSSPPATEGHKKVDFPGRRNFHVTDSVLHSKTGYSSTPTIQHEKNGSISMPTQQRAKKNSSSVSPTQDAKENSSSPPATEGHKKVGFPGRRNFHVTDSVLHTKQGYSSTSTIQHKKTGSISTPTKQRTKKISSSVSPMQHSKENSCNPPTTEGHKEIGLPCRRNFDSVLQTKKSYSSIPTTQHEKTGSISIPTQQHAKKDSSSISHMQAKNSSSSPTTKGHKENDVPHRRNFHVTDPVLRTKKSSSSTPTTRPAKNGSSSLPVTQHIKKNNSNSNMTDPVKELYSLCAKCTSTDAEELAPWKKLFLAKANTILTTQPVKNGSRSSIPVKEHITKSNSNMNMTDREKEVFHLCTYSDLIFGERQPLWEKLTGRSDIKIPFIPYDQRPKKKDEFNLNLQLTNSDVKSIWDTIYVRDRKKAPKVPALLLGPELPDASTSESTECHIEKTTNKSSVQQKVNVPKLPKTKNKCIKKMQ